MLAAGLRPWAPTNDRDAVARALAAETVTTPGGFAEKFDEAPVLLAAHDEGLGGVITTIAIREEEQVKALLGAPDPLALAAVIALGYPVRRPRRLRREPVASFANVDSIGGPVRGAP